MTQSRHYRDAVAAVGEYVWDVLPNTPSRTQALGLSARVISGAFVGWLIALILTPRTASEVAVAKLETIFLLIGLLPIRR